MSTEVVTVDSREPELGVLEQAASLVDGGGLVVFPTETVYGIACKVSNQALARLDRVKQRRSQKHYTLHIAEKGSVYRYVPNMTLQARKLAEQAWPGPLTLVFDLDEPELESRRAVLGQEIVENLYRDGSVGIRCPENRIATMLLERCRSSVVAPSANVSGQEPTTAAAGVLGQVSDRVDLVIDGGRCKYGRSSTVAKTTRGGVKVLREGVWSEDRVRAMAKLRFLFVCTGNTCRSPMAEGFLKKHLAEKLGCALDQLDQVGYKVSSAGLIEPDGRPATPEAIAVCASKGIDIRTHRSRLLTKQLVEESDFIYAMCRAHRRQVISLSKEAEQRCVLLASDEEVSDPIGQPQHVYDSCAELIEKAVEEKINELVI
jgi:protein-tyrosine phosphatase